MSGSAITNDPLWPRAGRWLAASSATGRGDFALLGVPAYRSSITPTGAHATPGAVREALLRYSTYSASHAIDLSEIHAHDLGDVEEPDGPEGEARVAAALANAPGNSGLLVAIGGDNSITYSLMKGLAGAALSDWGLITVDAHHDLRDGETNGSPVRRLLDAGLQGTHIVQIGIADFANSAAYAKRASDNGITVVSRAELRGRDMADVAVRALDIAGAGGRPVYVDLDVDVCDRAEVPACPSSAPGGISADELRELAHRFGCNSHVRAIDITEIDATIDAPDQRTVRLAALLVLEAAAGYAMRLG